MVHKKIQSVGISDQHTILYILRSVIAARPCVGTHGEDPRR